MKASQFSDAQKAFVLKQGDEGVPVAEICRKAGISQATYFNWKKKYAGTPIDGICPNLAGRFAGLLDRMAETGIVRSSPAPDGRRRLWEIAR